MSITVAAGHLLAQDPRPRFGTIPSACAYSGRSRSRLYQLAATHPDLFVKDGKSTLVVFAVLDRILDRLPAAKIKGVAG